jgi:hypothetical protein
MAQEQETRELVPASLPDVRIEADWHEYLGIARSHADKGLFFVELGPFLPQRRAVQREFVLRSR